MVECIQNNVSRSWLETLSTGELMELAENYGIDVPAELERIFIIEEILDFAETEFNLPAEEDGQDDIAGNPDYSETVPLPKQYNISYVEVMIRDPLWAFVFWEIKLHDREVHEKADDFKGYCLHVIPINEDAAEQQSKENTFTASVNVPESIQDCARYLGFADAAGQSPNNPGRYVITLNAIHGESEELIASSQIFDLPKLFENENIAEISSNPLISLSGIHELSITKKTDRQPRNKRQ